MSSLSGSPLSELLGSMMLIAVGATNQPGENSPGLSGCSESSSPASGRRAAKVLVGQQHFVEVGRDGDLVVFEVAEPGAAAVDGIGQQRQNLGGGNGHAVLTRLVLRECGSRGVSRSTIQLKM